MCLKNWLVAVLLLCLTSVCAAGNSIVPTTTLTALKANNTSAAQSFSGQTNGNVGAGSVSKLDVHSLLYPGANTKIYAHLLLWFGGSNHMNVGYSSTDAAQIHRQIMDMISRGIDGVIIDWYGPNNSIDTATKLVMAEAEKHPGFTFAIMIDQGAIEWDSCSACSPQQALISQLQYVEQTYFSSPAYMAVQGRPVVTNFDIDLSYSVNWNEVGAALGTQPAFLFQNNDGFTHVMSDGSFSWVMPTTSDYGMSYLTNFYQAGMPLNNEQTVGASYKGFNDSLASWGSSRIMGQQCGQTWLQTFANVNRLYNSGQQLSALQLLTWNDYEEATEIESGIDNCLGVSASASNNSIHWMISGDESTIDHYVAYISTDGQNLMSLGEAYPGTDSVNLCSYSIPDGNYTVFVQAVGKPSLRNQISSGAKAIVACQGASSSGSDAGLTLNTNPSAMTVSSGSSGTLSVTVAPQSQPFNGVISLTCSGLPKNWNCSFTPALVTPGAKGATSALTVSAVSESAASHDEGRRFFLANWTLGFGLFGLMAMGKVRRRRAVAALGSCALVVILLGTISCGGNSPRSGGIPTSSGTNSYVVTINGNSSGVQLSTTVTVTVK